MTLEKILNDTLSKEIKLTKTIVLYGAGNFAKECLTTLKKHNYEVLFIIDKYKGKQNLFIDSVPVISFDDSRLTEQIKINSSCILSIFNAYVDLALIQDDIRAENFVNIINPMEFIDLFYDDMGDHFWLTSVKNLKAYKKEILDAYNKLEDTHSKILFQNIIEYRLKKELKHIQSPQNVHTQYIPLDININYPKLNFIDCGAYDGDTIIHFIKNNIDIESFIAFEPDISNLEKLNKNLKEYEDIEGFIYPSGVYSSSKQLRFSGGQGSASHIDNQGDDVIQVVSMDEVLLNYKVNFIKMDIEGAEIEALLGAKNLIQKNTPILALSAYHKFDDLWTITALLSQWKLKYSFYLRIYEHNGFGLVYYALPKKYLLKKD
ncbi:FkbM family methyltransferase [Sulfurovum sp. NBC37-1]|uniref:FkbM family methyltransferase n=1 Tax=Sulfurovum sp. (strain NBC37-1) TaxID=387093 RepID=UPI0001587BD4|nr:FkbM family methyltransferase [Sulfurovum sp. NBC37-1]BAF73081.1 methyltransferase FkbM [Sulfurovum sp. NBC37-1]